MCRELCSIYADINVLYIRSDPCGTEKRYSTQIHISPLRIILEIILEADLVLFVWLQSSGDESAVLWLDQIQEAIHTANQDEERALSCV